MQDERKESLDRSYWIIINDMVELFRGRCCDHWLDQFVGK